jgi:hypothetical protein
MILSLEAEHAAFLCAVHHADETTGTEREGWLDNASDVFRCIARDYPIEAVRIYHHIAHLIERGEAA